MDFRRALITGGAGFLGSHLIERLTKENFEIIVLDDLSSGKLDNISSYVGQKGFDIEIGDVRDSKLLKKLLRNVDLVFHLAAITSMEECLKKPILTSSVNADGTLNLLRCCMSHDVDTLIFASSSAVYGDQISCPINEETVSKPKSHYGKSKLKAERYCKYFHEKYGLDYVSLRIFNLYGPGQKVSPTGNVIANFITRLKDGNPPIIYGDGKQTRDFLYIKDCVDAFISACEADRNLKNETYNIGSGTETSINELLRIIAELMDANQIKQIFKDPRINEIDRCVADIAKAKNKLGFMPTTPLKEGLMDIIKSY